jgi:hypothetical protein
MHTEVRNAADSVGETAETVKNVAANTGKVADAINEVADATEKLRLKFKPDWEARLEPIGRRFPLASGLFVFCLHAPIISP